MIPRVLAWCGVLLVAYLGYQFSAAWRNPWDAAIAKPAGITEFVGGLPTYQGCGEKCE